MLSFLNEFRDFVCFSKCLGEDWEIVWDCFWLFCCPFRLPQFALVQKKLDQKSQRRYRMCYGWDDFTSKLQEQCAKLQSSCEKVDSCKVGFLGLVRDGGLRVDLEQTV